MMSLALLIEHEQHTAEGYTSILNKSIRVVCYSPGMHRDLYHYLSSICSDVVRPDLIIQTPYFSVTDI
jgi:hypothetical protein